MGDDTIPTVFDKDIAFLGHKIFAEKKAANTFKYVREIIETKLSNLDETKIIGPYKLKIMKCYLLPALRFLLTVHDLSHTNLQTLDAIQNKYMKKWVGLAHQLRRWSSTRNIF